jgi:hypothetical protein
MSGTTGCLRLAAGGALATGTGASRPRFRHIFTAAAPPRAAPRAGAFATIAAVMHTGQTICRGGANGQMGQREALLPRGTDVAFR